MDLSPETADLVALGLTHYEAKAYLGLIGRDRATPAEVARISGIPRQRTYDVLAQLAERGLVRALEGKPLSYIATSPDRVAGRLIGLRQEEMRRHQQLAARLVERLTPLFDAAQGEDSPLDYVEVLRDGAHAAQRIGQLLLDATDEVAGLVRPPYLAPPSPDEVRLGPAARQRVVYESGLLEDPAMVRVLQRFAELGEEVRVGPDLPLKMLIFDNRSVAFNLPDPVSGGSGVTTLIVHHPMLAATLAMSFETVWERSTPLAEHLAVRG